MTALRLQTGDEHGTCASSVGGGGVVSDRARRTFSLRPEQAHNKA